LRSGGGHGGDRRADILVGTWPRGLGGTGGAYVVFGQDRAGAAVDLAHLGANGIAFDGGKRETGAWLDGLGDVNGDGLGDVMPGAPSERRHGKGRAYVVYGRTAAGAVNLAQIRSGTGYAVSGPVEAGVGARRSFQGGALRARISREWAARRGTSSASRAVHAEALEGRRWCAFRRPERSARASRQRATGNARSA
jgi:hypothetical protein